MKNTLVIFLLTLAAFISSCSSIKEQTRKGMDLNISIDNSELLTGCNMQGSRKVLFLYRLLTDSNDFFDTTSIKYNLCIIPIDKKHLQVTLWHDSSSISALTVKGHYRDGYFRIRRWKSKMIVGPLVWSLTDQLTYVGISKENKLVLINTTGGQLLFIIFPFMAAQSPDIVYEFDWKK